MADGMPDQLRDLIDSVRTQLHADLDVQLGKLADRHEQALADARHNVQHETRRRLLSSIRDIDAAQSVSGTLTAIVRAAAQEAPRAALFVGSGGARDEWVVDGTPLMNDCEQATVAIPLLLDGDQVAVLCGHDDSTGLDVEDWRGGLAVIASHGASRLACITAIRTAQAMRWLNGAGVTTEAPRSPDEEEQAAKRYARLLVSDQTLAGGDRSLLE